MFKGETFNICFCFESNLNTFHESNFYHLACLFLTNKWDMFLQCQTSSKNNCFHFLCPWYFPEFELRQNKNQLKEERQSCRPAMEGVACRGCRGHAHSSGLYDLAGRGCCQAELLPGRTGNFLSWKNSKSDFKFYFCVCLFVCLCVYLFNYLFFGGGGWGVILFCI